MAEYAKQYKPLYCENDVARDETFLYNIFFVLRRLAIVFIAMVMDGLPHLQMMVFIAISQAISGYLATARPMKTWVQNFIEIVNELLVFATAVVVLTLSGNDGGTLPQR